MKSKKIVSPAGIFSGYALRATCGSARVERHTGASLYTYELPMHNEQSMMSKKLSPDWLSQKQRWSVINAISTHQPYITTLLGPIGPQSVVIYGWFV